MPKERLKYLLVPNDKDIDKFTKYNFNGYILPLENFSVGFDTYFSVDEINELSSRYNIYITINKFLHKSDIENIKKVILKLEHIKGYFIEDLGLANVIQKDKIIINQSHIITNIDSVNYFYELGMKSIVISNELTIEEIKEILNNTKSNCYYNLVGRNVLMYSRRKLLSSFFENYKIKKLKNSYLITEKVTHKEMIIKEEETCSLIFDKNIFSANKYLDELNNCEGVIININNMSIDEVNIVLSNYKCKDLENLDTDNYFTENKIGYKVK